MGLLREWLRRLGRARWTGRADRPTAPAPDPGAASGGAPDAAGAAPAAALIERLVGAAGPRHAAFYARDVYGPPTDLAAFDAAGARMDAEIAQALDALVRLEPVALPALLEARAQARQAGDRALERALDSVLRRLGHRDGPPAT